MIPESYYDLINKLYVKAEAGQINWQTTAAKNKFIVYFQNFSISLEFERSEDQEPDFVTFRIYDNTGHEIDSFWIGSHEIEGWYEKSYQLYSAARRKALRIDDAINSITKELDVHGPVGQTESDDFIPEIADDDVPL